MSIGRAVGRTSASASTGSRPGPSATAGRQGVGVVFGSWSVAFDESGVCRAEDSRDGGRQIFCRAEGRAEGRSSPSIEGRSSPSRAEDRSSAGRKVGRHLQSGRQGDG